MLWIAELVEYSEVLEGDTTCVVCLEATTEEAATEEAKALFLPHTKSAKLYKAELVKELL